MTSPHIHVPYDKIGENLSFINEHKINLEIYFGSETLDRIGVGDIEKLLSRLEYAPSLSIHAPFMDLSPGAVDSKAREITMERFNQVMDIASVLKPKVVVFHSGYEKWKYALDIDLWLEKSLMTWHDIVERALKMNTKVAIENIFEDSPDNLRMLVEKVGSPFFGLCFDTGHFNLFSRVPLEEWIRQTGRHITALHIHDNDKTRDAHLSPGSGTFNFGLLFDLLKDRDDIVRTIEAHSKAEVLKSFAALKNLLTI